MFIFNAVLSVHLFSPSFLTGVCDNIGSGSVSVALNVGACSGYGYFDCYTGWNAVSRIIVEELPASPYS